MFCVLDKKKQPREYSHQYAVDTPNQINANCLLSKEVDPNLNASYALLANLGFKAI